MSETNQETREPETLDTGNGSAGPGIMGLAALPMDTPIDRAALARMLGKCETSIDRAVRRGELCPPVRIMGRPTWTRRAIMRHLEARLEQAQELAAKRLKLAP